MALKAFSFSNSHHCFGQISMLSLSCVIRLGSLGPCDVICSQPMLVAANCAKCLGQIIFSALPYFLSCLPVLSHLIHTLFMGRLSLVSGRSRMNLFAADCLVAMTLTAVLVWLPWGHSFLWNGTAWPQYLHHKWLHIKLISRIPKKYDNMKFAVNSEWTITATPKHEKSLQTSISTAQRNSWSSLKKISSHIQQVLPGWVYGRSDGLESVVHGPACCFTDGNKGYCCCYCCYYFSY